MRKVADRSRLGKLVLLSMFCSACELVLGDLPEKPETDAGVTWEQPDSAVDTEVSSDARDAKVALDDGSAPAGPATPEAGVPADASATEDAPPDASMASAPCLGMQGRTVYRDADADGYGDPATAQTRCGVLDSTWVEVAGDCNDQDVNVHPGQQAFFGAGYLTRNGTGGLSFDYDCDGGEVARPDLKLAPPSCVGLLVCLGGGYLPNGARPPAQGVNVYCGSNVMSFCTGSGLLCQETPSTTEARYACN